MLHRQYAPLVPWQPVQYGVAEKPKGGQQPWQRARGYVEVPAPRQQHQQQLFQRYTAADPSTASTPSTPSMTPSTPMTPLQEMLVPQGPFKVPRSLQEKSGQKPAVQKPRFSAEQVSTHRGTAQSEWNSELKVVSLGSCCAVKDSIRKVGCDAESLPFDWMKTRVDGVLRYITQDFDGFFDVTTSQSVPGMSAHSMVMHRDYYHSFWHDDLNDLEVLEKYRRRIRRFQDLRSDGKPILFVRSIAETEELAKTQELLDVLKAHFGAESKLLLILDLQVRHRGAVLLQSCPNLLVYFSEPAAHQRCMGAPYVDAVRCAVAWADGADVGATQVANMKQLSAMADAMMAITVHGLAVFEAYPAFPLPLRSSVAGSVTYRASHPILPLDPQGVKDFKAATHTDAQRSAERCMLGHALLQFALCPRTTRR
mmetsp:Transcript_44346/g.80346  ORF Transcript_44346/g.80346 Transcript_44346/m.80346 type:complete len:424 (-) Transcript_44346:578-1849(-)